MPHIFTISPKAILICINYWLAKKLNVVCGHRVSRLTVEVQQLTGCSCSVIGILGMLSLPEAKSHLAGLSLYTVKYQYKNYSCPGLLSTLRTSNFESAICT